MPKPATRFLVKDDEDRYLIMTIEREEYGPDNRTVRFFFYLEENSSKEEPDADAEPLMSLDEESTRILASVLCRYVEPFDIPDDLKTGVGPDR